MNNNNPLDIINELDNELYENVLRNRDSAFMDGALPKKTKLLIGIALDASRGTVNGVKSLVNQALEIGATKEEIMESFQVANFISGSGSVYTAATALKDIF